MYQKNQVVLFSKIDCIFLFALQALRKLIFFQDLTTFISFRIRMKLELNRSLSPIHLTHNLKAMIK
jgi:hypothetical protein